MPRACPVECSRSPLQKTSIHFTRCHGLAPWSPHVRRYKRQAYTSADATGLSRGVLTFAATKDKHTLQQMPRACPLECSRSLLQETNNPFHRRGARGVAASVNTPRGKPVASSRV